MRAIQLIFCFCLILAAPALAAITFPQLTGRVVDNAHVLSQSALQSMEQELADYERGTTNQVVVVTIPSLEGYSIEDYGYQLGRHWRIGQKGKDNGALLIVAPNERKVRIEVGYGLEPVLTDAASSAIINSIILPDFRDNRMEQGIKDGTAAMLSVLGGKGLPTVHDTGDIFWLKLLFLIIFFFMFMRHPFFTLWLLSGPNRFGSSRSGSSGWGGGGFSGGGGNFGGGGSSGSW